MSFLTSAIAAISLSTLGFAGASLTGILEASACPKTDAKKQDGEVAKLSVDKAATLHKEGKVIMVDANGTSTRTKVGYVPGARLLSSYDKFAMSELKASKDDTLVFYCYNESCSAAPRAAELARSKGYNAKVMDAGIVGWKKAGNPTEKLSGKNS